MTSEQKDHNRQALSAPVTARLPTHLYRRLDTVAKNTGRHRSDLLTEAVDTWLRLHFAQIDARQFVISTNISFNDQVAAVETSLQQALELLADARAQMVQVLQAPKRDMGPAQDMSGMVPGRVYTAWGTDPDNMEWTDAGPLGDLSETPE